MKKIQLVLAVTLGFFACEAVVAQASDAQISTERKNDLTDKMAVRQMKKITAQVDERKWTRSQISRLVGIRIMTSLAEDVCPVDAQMFASPGWRQGIQAFFPHTGIIVAHACWRGPNDQGAIQFCRVPLDSDIKPDRDCEFLSVRFFEATSTTKMRVAAL